MDNLLTVSSFASQFGSTFSEPLRCPCRLRSNGLDSPESRWKSIPVVPVFAATSLLQHSDTRSRLLKSALIGYLGCRRHRAHSKSGGAPSTRDTLGWLLRAAGPIQ